MDIFDDELSIRVGFIEVRRLLLIISDIIVAPS